MKYARQFKQPFTEKQVVAVMNNTYEELSIALPGFKGKDVKLMADELNSMFNAEDVKIFCETITFVKPDMLFTTIEEVQKNVVEIAKEFNYEVSFKN